MKADVMPPVALTAPHLSPDEIFALLKNGIDPSRILIREIDRIAFASDASFYRLIPRAVVQPSDAEEVRYLFRFSHEHRIPLVFRAGGTSLSGQSITDGILVDVGRYWRSSRVEENGKAIRVQPGVLGQHANDSLRLYRAKIGPDPASISSCRLGGILSNNASGMCCGVSQNAYHTLRSLTFVLPSGTEINTAREDADSLFRELEPELYNGLLKLKLQIVNNSAVSSRIRRKYLTKEHYGIWPQCVSRFRSPHRYLQPPADRCRGNACIRCRGSAQYRAGQSREIHRPASLRRSACGLFCNCAFARCGSRCA